MKHPTLLLALCLLLSACAQQSAPESVAMPPAPAPSENIIQGTRIVEVTAENWKFTPNLIRAQKGESVEIEIMSTSGTHGFAVPKLGINEKIEEGETVTIPLPTDTAGTFNFLCSVPCGAGHRDMTGQIIIEE